MREIHTDFEALGRQKLLRYLAGALLTGLGAAIVGPFGTYETMYVGARYFFWIATVTLGWAQMLIISYGTRAVLMRSGVPGWFVMLAAAAVGSVPILFEVQLIGEYLMGDEFGFPPLWLGYANVYFITLVFSLLQWVAVERWPLTGGGPVPADARPETPQAAAPLDRLSRMPDGLTGAILCLEMEDHYLRVHTEDGSGLILHRLGDAVSELAAADGMQVHRSWWVAARAVDRVETENRQRFLVLCNGLRVPVSRNYLPAVRDAGWIQ